MRNILLLLIFTSLISCKPDNSGNANSLPEKHSKEDNKDQLLNDSTNVTSLIVNEPNYKIEELLSLDGSVWIDTPFPNCTDTLSMSKGSGEFYLCELDLPYDITYQVKSDTLFVDLYGLISEVNGELGTEIQSKYKFIKSSGKLIMIGISYKHADRFVSVEQEHPYKELIRIE